MIKLQNTENLTGVSISGDFYDLDNLVDALHKITIDEFSETNSEYVDMSTRVLGVCYDIRHALQGDREIVLMDNNMDNEKMRYHSTITNTNNVYYKCNCFYPEMFYVTLALNRLVKIRVKELSKKNYSYDCYTDKNVVWDDTIAVIRNFQSEFAKCVKELITERSFVMWLKYMNEENFFISDIYHQFLDILNLQYIKMTKEKRLKNLTKISKRIVEFDYDMEYEDIQKSINEAAIKYNCPKSEIIFEDMEYPRVTEW